MVSNWIRLFGGMLTVRVRSAEPERFLNLCTQEHIHLHAITREDIDSLCADISLRDFYRLARLKRRRRCRIHILRRRGLPFFMQRVRRRYGLWAGMILLCLLCYELSARIWIIRTDFPQGVDGAAVMRELEQLHIGIGTKRSDIDVHAVKVHMMTVRDDLKFFALNLDGNTMYVETAAATERPALEQRGGVTNVIALQDGIVERMTVRRGTAKCKPGDAVLTGELLVDALVEPKGELGKMRFTDADAEIWAATRRRVTRKMALEANKKHKTTGSKTRYAICFGKTRINLYFGSSLTQGNCDRIISITTARINDYFVLPVALYRETVTPYTVTPVTHTAEELRAQMEYGARRAVEKQVAEGSFSSMQADIREEDGAAVLRATVWCHEQIAARVADGRTEADLPQTEEQPQQ
ncbi:MAG TPA: hypothetical protein DDX51_07620 [Clostridiales bacterium]|nr:hypothetical protein [Clostridiales bacterium]